jgi:hypothetical protein
VFSSKCYLWMYAHYLWINGHEIQNILDIYSLKLFIT